MRIPPRRGPVLTVIAVAILSGCTPEQDQAPKAADIPAYEVVKTTERGLTMDLTAEVTATPPGQGLRAIFDDIRAKYDHAGGYFIAINCSTGHRAEYEHRLAFGRYGVGKEGQATTGLDDGEVEFKTISERDCPAT